MLRMTRTRAASLALLGFIALASACAASAGDFRKSGQVTYVVDGDTIDVRLANGILERVRLIGIDTPERGTCHAADATAAARSLAQGKQVSLVGDGTQATRDRYGRLLAYVWLPGGHDLGFQLIGGGHGAVYVYDRAFKRLGAYQNAEAVGRVRPSSMWRCGAAREISPVTNTPKTKPKARPRSCHPSYQGACLDSNAYDYDCAGGSGNGPVYTGRVRVVGSDPFGLDGDGDGVGCDT
jgi:endonuclease YncB( thermonuclease family)